MVFVKGVAWVETLLQERWLFARPCRATVPRFSKLIAMDIEQHKVAIQGTPMAIVHEHESVATFGELGGSPTRQKGFPQKTVDEQKEP